MSTEEQENQLWNFTRSVVVLGIICLASGSTLGGLYWAAEARLERNKRKVFNTTLKQAMGDFQERFAVGDYPDDADNSDKVFGAETDEGTVYAAMGAAQGYQSTVRVIAAVRAKQPEAPVPENPEILRLVALPTQETPGMGEKIHKVKKTTSVWAALFGAETEASDRRPAFQKQFGGVKLKQLPGPKDSMGRDQPVEAITGATITSRAVVRAARKALKKIVTRTSKAYGGGGAERESE